VEAISKVRRTHNKKEKKSCMGRFISVLDENKPGALRSFFGVAVINAKNHKRQRRKRQSVTAKRENSQTPKVLTAILTLPNLT